MRTVVTAPPPPSSRVRLPGCVNPLLLPEPSLPGSCASPGSLLRLLVFLDQEIARLLGFSLGSGAAVSLPFSV